MKQPPKPNLLIAGHGYLGQEVARQAVAEGMPVTTLTRSGTGADHACDLTDLTAVQELAGRINPTHLLASASSGRGGTDAYRAIFRDGTRHLLDAFPDAKLTFISSTSVYRQTDGSTVTEESDTAGQTEKSEILREAEDMTLEAGGTVLRLSGIYGTSRSYILSALLGQSYRLEVTQSPAGTQEIGKRIINQIHVSDAAKAVLHLLTHDLAGLFNVSDDCPISQYELVTALCDKLALPLPQTAPPNPQSKRGWTNKAVSNARLKMTGWSPAYPHFLASVEEILPTISPKS
ncbi:MAG: NAD-dependent epimerase/dehydratase family protein [Verrucomicrobiota bacterium JB023]|nr:NAD-dependent epimerase/dehydratase family protein [Verrucomicrobiota bacterium JB023]